jgi:hypothetical protein
MNYIKRSVELKFPNFGMIKLSTVDEGLEYVEIMVVDIDDKLVTGVLDNQDVEILIRELRTWRFE